MIKLQTLLDYVVKDNTLNEYLFALALVFLVPAGVRITRHVVLPWWKIRAKNTKTLIDDWLIKWIDSFRWFAMILVGLFASTFIIEYQDWVPKVLKLPLYWFSILYMARFLTLGAKLFEKKLTQVDKSRRPNMAGVQITSTLVQIIIWFVSIGFCFSLWKQNFWGMFGSLGVVGIMVGLTITPIIKNITAALMIIFISKPFRLRDFVVDRNGESLGTVIEINMMTTKFEAVEGFEISIPNWDVLQMHLCNMSRWERRRHNFNGFWISRHNDPDLMETVPDLFEEVINTLENVVESKFWFGETTEWGQEVCGYYRLNTTDFDVHREVLKKLIPGLMRCCTANGIKLAVRKVKNYIKTS